MAKEKTAYHEAGHTVAAYLLRRKFKYVSLEANEGSLGHMVLRGINKLEVQIEDASIRPELERDIMILAAGDAAEMIFSEPCTWWGSKKDIHDAVNLASYVTGSNEETEAYLKWLFLRIRNKLKQPMHWVATIALAEELLKKQRIGYMAARKIIKEAMTQ